MDAKYVQGMINNLDLQPNVTINRWITGILLFSFHLVHIPTTHHTGADGLSRCLLSDEDPPEEDDFEDWLDNSYSFSITLLNDRISPYGGFAHFSRHPPGPLSDSCLVQIAPYDDALPTYLDSPFLFLFVSLVVWNRFPIMSSLSTLNPLLLYFNPVVAHLDLLRLLLSYWDKSYPYPSLLLNLY